MTLSAAPGLPRSFIFWLCCLGALVFSGTSVRAVDWLKINKSELAETTPKIDPEAGAEILIRDVVLDYTSIEGAEETHYIRAKIFSERGIKYFSLVKIASKSDQKISGLYARTIKPDGTIVEVKSDDIHSREERRDNEGRIRTKTFAFPALEVGAIVEYKYYLSSKSPKFLAPIVFQANLPIRRVHFRVGMLRPTPNLVFQADVRSLSYHCPNQKLDARADGFYEFELTNLPAAKQEPYAPPMIMNCASMLVYLSQSKNLPPADFWRQYSKELHKKYASPLKTTPDITAKATELTAGVQSPEDKLLKLYNWCRTGITNLERDTTRLSAEQRKALKKNDDANDVLKAGVGTGFDVNLLFIALARAAGLDARVAACNNRFELIYNEIITEPRFVFPNPVAAVQLGGEWKFFDPGATYLPFGQLRPRNTDTTILVSDPKGQESPAFIQGEPPEKNLVQRKADLRLTSGGTLEGDVVEIYSGQEDFSLKNLLDDKTPEKRAEYFRGRLLRQYKQARITDVVVENAADPLTNTKVTYHVRMPSYAEKTGSRLFIQPAVFQKGGTKRFSLPDGERKTPLLFPHRFQTRDEINIVIPIGYVLEAASAPAPISVGGLCSSETQITFNRVKNVLSCRRELSLTNLIFKASVYAKIKTVLDKIRENDDHTLTLKRDESIEAPPDEAPEKPEVANDADAKSTSAEDGKSEMEFAP
ncbi:MAG: DUF3857 and transglutaminase domain-containing protein [Nibricoccus sp.]